MIFSTLCCITSKLALHGNKRSPKVNKSFFHCTVSFLLAKDSVTLNTNLLPLHQFLNIYGVTHRHKTGFLITPTLHAALNLGQDVTLTEPQLMIYLSHFHMRKLGFSQCKLKGMVSSPFSFQTQFGNIFLIAPIFSPRCLQNKQYHLFQFETMFCLEISN